MKKLNFVYSLVAASLMLMTSWSYAILNIELTNWVNNAVPIGVIPFSGQAQDLTGDDNIAGIISNDLKNSGRFKLFDSVKMSEFPNSPTEIKYPYWREKNLDNLIVGQVNDLGNDHYEVQVSLINIFAAKNKNIMFSEKFTTTKSQLRQLAHHISDQIYLRLLGIRGVFSTRIAYIVVDRSQSPTRYFLEVADSDGFNAKQLLTSDQPIMSPAWSPNGKELAYVSFEKGHPQIFIQNVASGQRQLITNFNGINGAPCFSPDGKKLAVVLSKSGNPKIYTVNLANGQLTQLTHGYSIDTEPDWSPDGKTIIFTSNRGGSPQIYQLTLANSKVERLTYNGSFNARAMFTPDGNSMVLLHRDSQGSFDIAEQNLQTGTLKLLTRSGLDESPSIAPNGMEILYASNMGEKIQLAIVSTDGRVKLRLPSRLGDVQAPAWSPFIS